MPRGLPDYYNPDTVVSQRLQNLAGVVTALLGLSTIDSRGSLYWWDTFAQGLVAWALSQTGVGVDPAIDNTLAEVPPNSVYMDASRAGAAGTSTMQRWLYLYGASRLGLEVGKVTDAISSNLDIRLYFDNGTYNYYGRMAYFYSDDGIYILTPSGSTKITSVSNPSSFKGWTPLKLVIDPDAGKYVRLIAGNNAFDLSSYSLAHDASAYPGQARIWITAGDTVGGFKASSIGHVFLTTDEP